MSALFRDLWLATRHPHTDPQERKASLVDRPVEHLHLNGRFYLVQTNIEGPKRYPMT
jgi:hypothetical protein